MTITKEPSGFSAAHLYTTYGAHLRATRVGGSFRVSTASLAKDHGNYRSGHASWNFDANACREAAKFFTELAQELERRSIEES